MAARSRSTKTAASLSAEVKVTATTTETYALPKSFTFCIDTSRSMANKIKPAIRAMRDTAALGAGGRDDTVTLLHFSAESTLVFGQCPSARVRWDEAAADLRDAVAAGNGTALYDAIVEGIDGIPTKGGRADYQRELVVLTDGEDNRSSVTFDEVKAKLARPGVPNLHIIIIGVGISSRYAKRLRKLCTPKHCTYLDVGTSEAAIIEAFGVTVTGIREREIELMSLSLDSVRVGSGGHLALCAPAPSDRALRAGAGPSRSDDGRGAKKATARRPPPPSSAAGAAP